ncbi:MAG: preprotein translocase subunit SecG [Candidatus Omnitrophota bacterium]
MYGVIVVIHVIMSLILIAVILLQAGRGGGLSDTFAGSQMQSLFGTKSTNVLTKLTSVCAVGFIVTCILLALISSRQTRTLVDNVTIPQTAVPIEAAQPAPAEPAPLGGPEQPIE